MHFLFFPSFFVDKQLHHQIRYNDSLRFSQIAFQNISNCCLIRNSKRLIDMPEIILTWKTRKVWRGRNKSSDRLI